MLWNAWRRYDRWILALIFAALVLISSVPVSADDFEWRELFFDDLESGGDTITENWSLGPGWTIETTDDANHVLSGAGSAGTAWLQTGAPWEDHRLLMRIRLFAGSCSLRLRAGPAGEYRVVVTADQVTLQRHDADGLATELATTSWNLALGDWHYLMVTAHEDHIMVSLDRQQYLDHVDLLPIVEQGDFGLQLLPESRVECDDFWFSGRLPLPERPPDVWRIHAGEPTLDGFTTITGEPGAVPNGATVYLVNPETLDFATTTATADGSFQAELFAPEGATIQLGYGHAGARPFFEYIGQEGSPALLLTVPNRLSEQGTLPFTVAGRVKAGHWLARGALPRDSYAPGETLTATLHLRLRSTAVDKLDLDQLGLALKSSLLRLFDEQGRQLPPTRNLASAFLTPSGLPIEAQQEVANYWLSQRNYSGTHFQQQGHLLTATLPFSLTIPRELPPGTYRPHLDLGFETREGDSWQPVEALAWDDNYIMLERQDPNRRYPWPLLPPITVGDPGPARLTWALLTDYSANSERGVRALEDTHYSLSPRTVFPTHQLVLPPRHGATGQSLTYNLEPSLPLTAWGFRTLYERVLLCPPSIPLRYPSGQIHLEITRPDGTTEHISGGPFGSGVNPLRGYRPDDLDPTRRHRTMAQGLDNPGPSDYYRATTSDSRFEYAFTQYGKYVIQATGQMTDIWGRTYQAGGTYEIWVGHWLDLETGVTAGTPFQVGDYYSPVVRVQPGMPAEIMIDHRLYVNSDRKNVREQQITGRANRFGYYHPGMSTDPFPLSAPGEYDVRVIARYWDDQGRLWMGVIRSASVVETPNTPLEAHGERGIRSFAAVKRPLWFAEGNSGNVVPGQTDGLFEPQVLGGSLHLPYPYELGDVMWMVDLEGQNSVFPTLTFDDPSGDIASLLEARVPELRQGAYYYGQFPQDLLPIDRRAIGELPLVSISELGRDPGETYGWPVGAYPAHAHQIGYFYTSCARPGLGVAAQVSESGLGNAYWFADDTYNLQYGQGSNGDMAPDFKLNYGGLVFRDLAHDVNQYAIYASCDIYIPVGDPMSNRIMPPFQGAAGGPDGGPLMTLQGKDIDLFVHTTGVKPGTVLEVGDTFSFAAQVVPTLDSHVAVTVTMPSGRQRVIRGQANKIGYFYEPESDFVVTEPGRYRVHVRGEHRGQTSAGAVYPPYPHGGILGTTADSFDVYVVPNGSLPLTLDIPEKRTLPPAQPVILHGRAPKGWTDVQVYYTSRLSGFVLEQGTLSVEEGTFDYIYDPVALHARYPNLDIYIIREHLNFIPWQEPEMVDTVQINLCLTGRQGDTEMALARAVTLQGMQLYSPIQTSAQHVPMIMKG